MSCIQLIQTEVTTGGGNKLQDELMAKEEAKIQRKREANEQRRLRILNAKVRIIGLDVDALDAQVAEKRQNASNKSDIDRFEKTQAMEIERILAASMEEERQMKEYQMNEMKKSWSEAAYRRQQDKNKPKGPDFDPDNSGPASLQRFNGEDVGREQRKKEQKEQMRKWIRDQVAEKSYLSKLKKDEDMSYAEMIKAIDEIREATEREEQEMRKYIKDTVKLQNLELAAAHKQKYDSWNNQRMDGNNEPVCTSLQAFDEDKGMAMDENGRIIRVDMFKGFTAEQKRRLFQDNEDIIRQKNAANDNERRQDNDWLIQQEMALRAMELAEYEERCLREAQNEDRLAFLRRQMEEQRALKNEWERTRYGEVNSGFFDGFGRDCR